jgi:serine/threonine protein kinase
MTALADGPSVLVIAVRYFFRREVEVDAQLARALEFAKLERLQQRQEAGFRALETILAQHAQCVEELMERFDRGMLALHSEIRHQGELIRKLGEDLYAALQHRQELNSRPLNPRDSWTVRDDRERQFIKALVARYRALPAQQQEQLPALLNAVGKLEVVAGDFDAAQEDFCKAASLVDGDTEAQAEVHYNAYRAALERRDWTTAFREYQSAADRDRRFALFDTNKYEAQQILGAGGFGVAFRCRHLDMSADVVIKTLAAEELDGDVARVRSEAQALGQLQHPGIIAIRDCAYVNPDTKTRPYLVMDYFPGTTLEDHVEKHGALSEADFLEIAIRTARALQAAHDKQILHRDVKPANLLVLRDNTGWKIKLIDFGLALKHTSIRSTIPSKTILGHEVAGTLEYASPEQLGLLPGVSGGVCSDIYSFAKMCCYALFGTSQPTGDDWRTVDKRLNKLLSKCLKRNPQERPATFTDIVEELRRLQPPPPPPPPPPPDWLRKLLHNLGLGNFSVGGTVLAVLSSTAAVLVLMTCGCGTCLLVGCIRPTPNLNGAWSSDTGWEIHMVQDDNNNVTIQGIKVVNGMVLQMNGNGKIHRVFWKDNVHLEFRTNANTVGTAVLGIVDNGMKLEGSCHEAPLAPGVLKLQRIVNDPARKKL